jgi:hypothetical protein
MLTQLTYAAGGMVVPDASEAEEQALLADDMFY